MGLLNGKTALVSGVANSRSIAWGVAQVFREHGARVALTCLESTQRRVAKLGAELGASLVVPCDLTQEADITRTFGEVDAVFDGRLDVVVHSVAFADVEDMKGEFLRVTLEGWRTALDASAYSLIALARAARPFMRAAGGGSILTMTYAGGTRVSPGYNVMGVAKAALECTVRYLAYDLGPEGIRVNALSPGPIPTMSAIVIERFDESMQRLQACAPLLRTITPRDVGNAAVLYASDLAGAITGTTVFVDGGMNTLVASAGPHPRAG